MLDPLWHNCDAKSVAKQIDKLTRPKRPRDPNQLAHQLIAEATADDRMEAKPKQAVPPEVQRNMAETGKRGGEISGRHRAERMTEAERSDAAAMAARARWVKK